MASNKKKSAAKQMKQRQQKKQQRRQQRKQRQPTTSVRKPAPDLFSSGLQTAITPEVLSDFGSGNLIEVLETASKTGALLDEPEFADVELEPMTAVVTFISTAEELGFNPNSMANPEQMDEVLGAVIQKLLTPALRQEIVQATRALSDRARTTNDQPLLKQAAAIQFLLQEETLAITHPLIGLVRRLVSDGIEAGFGLVGLSTNFDAIGLGEVEELGVALPEQLKNSEMEAFIKKTLEDSPALRRHLEKQVDATFTAGQEAIGQGELVLNLYTPAELETLADQILTLWRVEDVTADANDEAHISDPAANNNEHMSKVAQLFDDYLVQLFTKERLTVAQRRIAALLDSPAYAESEWLPFLHMLQAALGTDDALETERYVLALALWIEIKPYLLNTTDEDEDEDEESDDKTELAENA